MHTEQSRAEQVEQSRQEEQSRQVEPTQLEPTQLVELAAVASALSLCLSVCVDPDPPAVTTMRAINASAS